MSTTNPESPPSSEKAESNASTTQASNRGMQVGLEFFGCAVALNISYLVWGFMQELLMTTKFNPTPLTPTGMFPSAAFCVFSNRFLAIIVAVVICQIKHGTVKSAAPLLSFTPCSLSNTISSWCQYQALTFVSFSVQTLFKATKVMPVMFMGYVLKRQLYDKIEYFEALTISAGVLLFSFAATDSKSTGETQAIGYILLCVYVAADSFTSQWQSRLFRDYGKIDSFHMMFGVNTSSIIISSVAILVSGEIPVVWEFLSYNPTALWYNILTAITSATGNIAIFYTIKRFGPVVFTVIMTTRQMLSIVLSTLYFQHPLPYDAAAGAAIVFMAVFHQAYRQTLAPSKESKSKTTPGEGSSSVAKTQSVNEKVRKFHPLFPVGVFIMTGSCILIVNPNLGWIWMVLYVVGAGAAYIIFFSDYVSRALRKPSNIELEPVNSEAREKLVSVERK